MVNFDNIMIESFTLQSEQNYTQGGMLFIINYTGLARLNLGADTGSMMSQGPLDFMKASKGAKIHQGLA
eukprot:scaffold498569_cov23-Prasinocladus_malaysianus.AAC.1